MAREPYWDYMSRRLREEDMKDSFHLKLDDTEKKYLDDLFKEPSESKILKMQTKELQGQLQQAYKRIKILNETISKQRDKIFYLENPAKQLEFRFR